MIKHTVVYYPEMMLIVFVLNLFVFANQMISVLSMGSNNFSNTSDFVLHVIEGLRAKRVYIKFLADFHFLQDRANF